MKLLNYLKNQIHDEGKIQLLNLYLVTLDASVKRLPIDPITDRFKIDKKKLSDHIKNMPSIEIDNKIFTYEINGHEILLKAKSKPDYISKEQEQQIKLVLNLLNEITGKGFRYSSKKNRSVILARIKEGYNIEAFRYVIQAQSIRWLGTKDEIYLRPETLFSGKMEGYFNAPMPKSSNDQNKLNKINEAIANSKNYDWESAGKKR